jgi:hypothetical protein
MSEAQPAQSDGHLDVTVHVCPVCLTAGEQFGRCPHYEGGSVGYVYYSRRPATITVVPVDWEPVHDSRESVA